VAVSNEVIRALEQRLHEVEAQLGAYAELTDERARLERALNELQPSDGAAAQHATNRPAARAGTRRRRAARRARRGSNIAAIVGHVETNPGATAAEIAAGTGIDRSVVYSATSRLTSAGRLRRIPKGDREVGYEVVDNGKATTEP
jgi:hypothetical protein